MKKLLMIIVVVAILSGCTSLKTPEINGVVVDDETGKPIEGVYVVARWVPVYSGPGGPGGGEKSKEARLNTDKNGKFNIPKYRLTNWYPYPFGQGGYFVFYLFTHEYKNEGYRFNKTKDISEPMRKEFQGIMEGKELTFRLEKIRDAEAFDRNYSDVYGLVDNDNAYRLQEYQLYVSKFPKGKEVLSYALSIGSIYEKMNQPEKAIQAYKKIIDQYPNTSAANEAYESIQKLKKK